MKNILITKADVDWGHNGCDDVDKVYSLLAQGALVAFAEDGTLLNASTTELFKNFYFALGTQEGPIISPLIDYKTMKYTKSAYVAPVTKIIVVGAETSGNGALNFPSSLTAYIGKSASIMLIDKRYEPNDKRREKYYNVPISDASTNLSILTALVAQINADDTKICSAAVAAGNAGIVLTGLYGDFAYVNMGGVFELTTLATSGGTVGPRAYVAGNGTSAQILQLEKDYSPNRGNTSDPISSKTVLYNATSQVVSGETYTTTCITWRAKEGATNDRSNFEQELIIAIPHDEYDSGESGYVLDALLAVVNVAEDATE